MNNKEQPTQEFKEALDEMEDMEKHPENYKVYHDADKMFKDILDE